MENKDTKKDIFTDGFKMDSHEEKLENEDISCQYEIAEPKEEMENKDFLANINKQSNESFEEEKFIHQKTDYRKWIIQFVFIVIVVIAVYFLLNQKVEIIDFTHMSYQNVADWASDKDVVITVDSNYSNEVDTDHVISQSIKPGE